MMVVVATALTASAAHAADCAESYTVDAMVEDLSSVETFLRNGDNELAGQAAQKLEAGLGCMNELLPRMIVGRALRAVGAGHVVQGDAGRGEDWLRTAAEIEQAFDFGLEDLPEVHPVRDAYANAKNTSGGEEIPVPDAALAAGTVYLDGRKLTEPKARIDRWHVVQLDDGAAVRSWVIEGSSFPDQVLVSTAPVLATTGKKPKEPKQPKEPKPEPVAKAPKAEPEQLDPVAGAPRPKPEPRPKPVTNAMTSANGTVVVERQRPWEKTPILVGGGAILAAGGAVYYASYVSHQKFLNATDNDELDGLWSETNRLAIASVAILGVGVGTFTWGVILDGEGAPLPALRFRF
jgi:hypothetical protein